MFAKISRYVRVYVNEKQIGFLAKYQGQWPMIQSKLDMDDIETAKVLADKSILVRKKLDHDTLYNLNRYVKFEYGKNKRNT
jgi:hypothetical protein